MSSYQSIEWRGNALRLLDQRRLPWETLYVDFVDAPAIAKAIRSMVVRGAPAIGAAAAYAVALTAANAAGGDPVALRAELLAAIDLLRTARPTAVNLFWALDRMQRCVKDVENATVADLRAATLREAHAIAADDVWTNRQIGLHALDLVPPGARIMHHCNTGSLATVDYGTALGIIRTAHEHGRGIHAYLDETRPRLQGASLSAWELIQLGVPHTVIVDGASGHFMRTTGVDLCVVGCDRVAANGDTANKIGTYNLALVAAAHDVPFYVAAPTSTIDLATAGGDDIAIEERPADEIHFVGGARITPEGAHVANPAFDITPAAYITAIITEMGIARPPYAASLPPLVAQADARRRQDQQS